MSYLLRWFERSVKSLESTPKTKPVWDADLQWLWSQHLNPSGGEWTASMQRLFDIRDWLLNVIYIDIQLINESILDIEY